MASPFPGMDPYLEAHWGDIHHALITYARDQLQGVLPGDLRARVEERVFVEYSEGQERKIYPDVRVVERGRRRSQARSGVAGIAVAEPLRIPLPDEPVTQGYIEIIDISTGRKLVTVIEVLSPANKFAGPGRKLYRQKQKECRQGRVNLVEIDLLRDGPWAMSVPKLVVPPPYRTPYRICVYRAAGTTRGEVYQTSLRGRLPVIKVPLRQRDADVPLDVQALIDEAYRNGGYDNDIDYRTEPEPPLSPTDARWADVLLQRAGKRRRPPSRRPGPNGKRRRKR